MKKINEIIVVEGKTDKIFLESFLDAEIVTTNGSEISEDTLKFIEELSKTRDILIMTDPDTPGKRIRDIIQQRIKNCKHCYIEKEKAIKGHKVGIAETSKEDILNALEKIVTYRDDTATFTQKDMIDFLLVGDEKSAQYRDYLCKKLFIDKSNGKTLLKKLNMMGVTREKVEEIMKGCKI